MEAMISNFINWLKGKGIDLKTKKEPSKQNVPSNMGSPCCNALVHIAYRGISDDRLYLVYDKKWSEVKFFRPHGLRVYCQKCRQRISKALN
jgi:hypothetical protein